jgi:hypothetical protein
MLKCHLKNLKVPVEAGGDMSDCTPATVLLATLLLVDGARKLAAGAKLTWEQTVLVRGG